MEPQYCHYSQCGKAIPPHLIKKYGPSRKYCDRTCSALGVAETRKADGFFARFSRLGIAKQREIQEATGERPGHTKRSQAMKEHNRLVPRHHVSGWHITKKS